MHHVWNRIYLVVIVIVVVSGVPVLAEDSRPVESGTVMVPMDYRASGMGEFPLYYELGQPFDPARPTVFVIADGMQSFLKPGVMAEIQARWFDSRFNVVGIPGRGQAKELAARCRTPDGGVDWETAYRVYSSVQWCSDIQMVRRTLLGETGRIMLFGGSGGGYLVLEYLSSFHRFVDRAFVFGAPIPPIDARLAAGNAEYFAEKLKHYPVSDALDLSGGNPDPAVCVRVYEVVHPILEKVSLEGSSVLENARKAAKPLLALQKNGEIPAPRFRLERLKRMDTELVLLTGARDTAASPQSHSECVRGLKHAVNLVVEDDHWFTQLKAAGVFYSTARTFLFNGAGSPEMAVQLKKLDPIRTGRTQ